MKQKQKGAIPLMMIAVVLVLLALGGGAAYYYVGPARQPKKETGVEREILVPSQVEVTEVPQQREESSRLSAPTLATDELANWQEYKNERFPYKVKYPSDWYFLKKGYNPPPPVAVMFSNLSEGYQPNVHYASVGIDVMSAEGESLEENGEVKNLVEEQYYQKTRITVSGEPALKLETPDKSESHFSVYILHRDNFYRMVCGESGPEQPKYGETFQKILDSFTFTD